MEPVLVWTPGQCERRVKQHQVRTWPHRKPHADRFSRVEGPKDRHGGNHLQHQQVSLSATAKIGLNLRCSPRINRFCTAKSIRRQHMHGYWLYLAICPKRDVRFLHVRIRTPRSLLGSDSRLRRVARLFTEEFEEWVRLGEFI